LSICIVHRRVRRTPLMRFSSVARAVDRTAVACSLQTQAGALAGQAAQSAVQRSPPSVTHIMGYYSFNQPRRDGRLSWPCWLTDSGRRIHKVVKQPSISLAQDKESPPARTDVLTTMLCHQLITSLSMQCKHITITITNFLVCLPMSSLATELLLVCGVIIVVSYTYVCFDVAVISDLNKTLVFKDNTVLISLCLTMGAACTRWKIGEGKFCKGCRSELSLCFSLSNLHP